LGKILIPQKFGFFWKWLKIKKHKGTQPQGLPKKIPPERIGNPFGKNTIIKLSNKNAPGIIGKKGLVSFLGSKGE